MTRPCDTCGGSGIDYQDTCVQCERPWGPGEPCGPESYAMPKPCPCPSCVDMPRLPKHHAIPWSMTTDCDVGVLRGINERGWFKPDPSTVMRWCLTHTMPMWSDRDWCFHGQVDEACKAVWVAAITEADILEEA